MRAPGFWDELGLQPGEYFVVTLHRPANVDKGDGFARLLAAIADGTRGLPVVFPVHPYTAKTLRELGEAPASFRLVDPQPYLEFNWLEDRVVKLPSSVPDGAMGVFSAENTDVHGSVRGKLTHSWDG